MSESLASGAYALQFGMIVGLIESGHTEEEMLWSYPYLEKEELPEAPVYAAWRVGEIDVPRANP